MYKIYYFKTYHTSVAKMKFDPSSLITNVDRHKIIQKQLEALGYENPLTDLADTLQLIQKLCKDMLILKEEIELYKEMLKKVEKVICTLSTLFLHHDWTWNISLKILY